MLDLVLLFTAWLLRVTLGLSVATNTISDKLTPTVPHIKQYFDFITVMTSICPFICLKRTQFLSTYFKICPKSNFAGENFTLLTCLMNVERSNA